MAKERREAEDPQVRKAFAKIIARAWSDEEFKRKLINNPAEAIKEYGLKPTPGKTLKVVINDSKTEYFHLPIKPSEAMSEEELRKVAAGACAVGDHACNTMIDR